MTQPDQEHHAKVCSIFVAARKLEPDERKAYIDAACGTDADLRRDVKMFLAVNDDDRAALLTNVLDEKFGDFVTDAITGDDAIPESVGRYRIIRKIGEGGMGVVYEAKQENPDRSVALKVIRPGVATPKLIRRFRYEAQVLGRLQHPGVAHIYEAGVSDSGEGMQPFFAMELIQGCPLLEHIEQSHLDTRQR
ncbi:MAG: protein kinase, partial [Planctomycetes bacterium]|nr:protein kinase [Planctomycetota bacterium]